MAYNEDGFVWARIRLINLDPDVNNSFSMLGRQIADGAMMVSDDVVVGVAQASSGVFEPQYSDKCFVILGSVTATRVCPSQFGGDGVTARMASLKNARKVFLLSPVS